MTESMRLGMSLGIPFYMKGTVVSGATPEPFKNNSINRWINIKHLIYLERKGEEPLLSNKKWNSYYLILTMKLNSLIPQEY